MFPTTILWNEVAVGFERLFGAAVGFETWRSRGGLLAMGLDLPVPGARRGLSPAAARTRLLGSGPAVRLNPREMGVVEV